MLEFVDFDGNKLDIKEVGGFGEPLLSLFVTSDDPEDLVGISVNLAHAKLLRDWLTIFINRR